MNLYLIKEETLISIAKKLRNIKNSDELILGGNFASEVEGVGNTLKGLIEGSAVDLIIPYGTTIINTYAFTGFTFLKSVMIPDTVTTIGSTSFSYCTALESIKIPKSVGYIDSYAFNNCTKCLVYDFSEHTFIPTLPNDTVFNAINTNAKIIVPGLKYFSWITATNWATYKDNITYRDDDMPFTIYGMNNVYTATKGMTWREWVNSEGHAFGYTLSGDGDTAGVIIPQSLTSGVELWVTDTDSGSYEPVQANQTIKCTHYTGY